MRWYKKQKIKIISMDMNDNVLDEQYFIKRTLFLGTEKMPIISWDNPIKSETK